MFNLQSRNRQSNSNRPASRTVATSLTNSAPDASARESSSGGESNAYAYNTLGAILRERREAMGVSLAEVETATRIRQKYLAAIEADDWHLVPGEIVGRGFLRNYAIYLGLEPNELIERRRAAMDPSVAATLRETSAGSSLPPERQVDYRPKALDLKDEPEGIDARQRNLTPLFAVLLVLVLAFAGWWLVGRFGGQTGELVSGVQTRVANVANPPTSTPTVSLLIAGTDATPSPTPVQEVASDNAAAPAPELATVAPTDALPLPPTETLPPPTDTPLPAPPPTDTPPPPPPTDTPLPAPPTDTPTPEPPPVTAPACPDPRSVITSPGINQVVGGVIDISGTATHENFQFYKLEFAPGSVDAASGDVAWNWFAGSNAGQVQGGRLGQLDTRGLANGVYTIRVVSVDLSANFPPPCGVTIIVQN